MLKIDRHQLQQQQTQSAQQRVDMVYIQTTKLYADNDLWRLCLTILLLQVVRHQLHVVDALCFTSLTLFPCPPSLITISIRRRKVYVKGE